MIVCIHSHANQHHQAFQLGLVHIRSPSSPPALLAVSTYPKQFTLRSRCLSSGLSCGVQENLEATDVLMNFGVWLKDTDSTCGENDGDWCTNIPTLCKYLEADHPFKVWWITSAPTSVNDIVADRLEHHLDIPTRCQLDPVTVLNRTAALYTLEPNAELRFEHYWHWTHLHVEANHAFNIQFLGRLAQPQQARWSAHQRRRHNRVWKQMCEGRGG